MVGPRFVLLTLAIPLLGMWIRPRVARIPVWFAAGLVTIALEMFVISMCGARWQWWMLVVVPLLLVAGCWFVVGSRATSPATSNQQPATAFALLVPILLLTSMILAAAATSGDYVFFWGVKGQRFGQQHMLDTAFTTDPSHYMHPDYPPLVPLYYAWTMLGGPAESNVAFDWWGGMLASAMFLALSSAAIRSFGRYARVRTIDELALFFAALYALFYMRNAVAGNAEPVLHFFEVVALAALTCWRERPDEHDLAAAIALTGVALTKVEGGVFVLLVVGITCLVRRRIWRMGLIPVSALATWLIFARFKGLTDTYIPRDDLSLRYLGITMHEMLRELSLHLWYIPWIVLAIMLFSGKVQAALPYLAAAFAFLVFLLLVYTRKEPHLEWSAGRTLMTPFLLAFFGVIAALPRGEPAPSS